MKPLLEVVDLCVTYAVRLHEREVALSGVSFVVERGETLGVLGESGSGKSTLAAALLRILHANGKIERGLVTFEGEDLMQLNASALQRIRGRFIASIFQEPLIALDPAIRVGQQVENVLAAHQPASRRVGLSVDVQTEVSGRLPIVVETTLYRIVQEALNNTIRHAKAKNVWIRAWKETQTLNCSIRDDGAGFDTGLNGKNARCGGLGLIAMRERLSALGGTLRIVSCPGQGTELSIRLPLENSHGN